MTDLQPLRPATRIVDAVYESLREGILSGVLPPGQPLSVPELARRLNVSRSPIREAVLQLVSDGLAVEQPRRGVVVATIELNDVLEIHEIREFVEALSARLCAERIDADGVAELRSIIARQEKCVAKDNAAGYFQTNAAFHEAIGRFSRNNRLHDILISLEGQMRIGLQRVSSEGEQRRRGVLEHAQIVNAIEKRDGDRAERLMREHIAKTRKRLTEQVRKARGEVAA
ncbi:MULTISPECIES: GntR family transcriptional regulator [unclassified Bradyrhizobium]|uniref:GntR family transcriptional regulator n=1 Tax=unclassified Bradyrhizobium TaxID=2631580 RepID=UPI0028E83062|nr:MULTISPECIES: GntR family transcriptional regulator [unclassified Bradyrhizobium]